MINNSYYPLDQELGSLLFNSMGRLCGDGMMSSQNGSHLIQKICYSVIQHLDWIDN